MQRIYFGEYRAERRRIHVQLFDQTDGVTPEIGEAGGTPGVYEYGAGAIVSANIGALVATLAAQGMYYSELGASASPLTKLGIHRLFYDSAATGPVDELFEVVPHPWLHDGLAQGGGAQVITLQSDASAVDDVYIDGYLTIIGGTGLGQSRQITDYVGNTKVATLDQPWQVQPDATTRYIIEPGSRLPALSSVWDTLVANASAAGSFGELFQPTRRGTAQAGTTTTVTLDALASSINGFYVGQLIIFVDGTGAGQSAFITGYNGTTKVATLGQTLTVALDNSSVWIIKQFGSIPGATAPTAGQVAAAVWEELLTSHTTPGSFGAGVPLEQNTPALIADTLLDRNLYGDSNTFPQVKFALAFLAGRWQDNGDGTISVYDADDSTIIGTISYSTRQRDAIGGIDSSAAA